MGLRGVGRGRRVGGQPIYELGISAAALRASLSLPRLMPMAVPFNIEHLTPQERIELAERLWDSLADADIDLTPAQAAELERRRARLANEGPQGRPWRESVDGAGTGGG